MPAQTASTVISVGHIIRMGISDRRGPRCSSGSLPSGSNCANGIFMRSVHANARPPAEAVKYCQHRLADNGGLADGAAQADMLRQVDVDARAEADQADPLAGVDLAVLRDEADAAARHAPGDLHEGDLAGRRIENEAVALIVLAGLVELGIEKLAGAIGYAADAAAHRRAVHVAGE